LTEMKPSKAYVIGVDSGTSSTRAILFDEKGEALAEGRQAYDVLRPQPGWVEQKALWWWDAFVGSVRDLLASCPVKPSEIQGLAITHQRITAVPVDKSMEPLRNAILWNDIRCSEQNEWALDKVGRRRIYQRTGYSPGIWTVYKAMWIRDKEPDVYDRMNKFLLVQDYLTYKLTGELVTTSSAAVMTGCLDVAHRHRWAEDILGQFGISSDIWIKTIQPGGQIAGKISSEAAQVTGLPAGLPVVTAAGDQPCGVVGVGVTRASMLGVNGGTSCSMETCTEKLPLDPDANYFIEISPMDTYFPENSIYSGGSALMNWLKATFSYGEETERVGDWEAFYNMAADAPPGNWGLMLIPYFSGATAPYWDLEARGVMFGFLMDHSKAHMVRAVMEGLAYETRRQMGFMEKGTGIPISEVRMYGGSARSDLWNQIFSDILGVKLCTTKTVETTALGAAICAAAGLGIYEGIEDAARHMVQVKEEYMPKADRRHLYDRLYHEVYCNFYDRVHDVVHGASGIIKDLSPA
jgi:sugar (pentulose or hexulose) kinase